MAPTLQDAPSSLSSSSPSVALTPDGIHVSPLDERQYKHLTLRNGLQALVVSDPVTESASAAMDVHVGFHCDPDEIPGLAHFCEHMLFLGTEKYPDENSYAAFLTANGGSSNAYTAARNTNYYFDVATPHLREALDRFAQFFIAPLFTTSATEREMNAVDSENKNYLQDDYWRINQVHRSLGNTKHPFRKFGVGNLESLHELPTQLGLDVREALLTYHAQYYSANMMKLVVYGKEDVETLSEWITTIFEDIRHNGRTGPPEFGPEMPFTESQLGRRLDVLPVKDLNIIGVSWLLPPLRGPRYTQQQTAVISHLIGHEGKGSLLSLLKKHNWVSTMSAGVEEEHAEFSLFLINFEATEEGMKHVDEIIEALFQVLRLLRESMPLEKWIFQEMEDLAIMHFLFQSKQAPIHFTSSVATSMRTLPKRDILSQDTLFFPEDNEQIGELLALLTPERMKLLVVCKANESIVDKEERWYKAKYRESVIDCDVLAKWASVPLHADLILPTPNEFVASDFSLIDKAKAVHAGKAPRRIRDDEWCRVWYKPDTHFKKPRTHVALTFYSPFVIDTPLSYVMSDLVVACVQDELTEYAYDASLAGMHYDLAVQGSCIHLGAVGFSAKLELLVLRVVETIVTLADTLQEETFERVHQQARKSYENMKFDEAFRLAMDNTSAIMQERAYPTDDLIEAITQIEGNVYALRQHARRILDQVYLEALIYGNLYEQDAFEMIENVLKHFATTRPVLSSQHSKWLPRQLCLPERATSVYRYEHPNGDNLNCAIDCIFQIGPETMRDRVALAVFSQIVNEPLFNQLRTKEQLGYTVFSTPSRQSGIQWFRVIVQSNVASSEYLDQRLRAFFMSMHDVLRYKLTDEQLEQHKQAIIKDYTEKPKSQEEEVQALSLEIANHEYQFDRRGRLARLVATLQRSDIVAFFETYIATDAPKHKQLSVRIYSKNLPVPSLERPAHSSSSPFSADIQTALVAAASLVSSHGSSGTHEIPISHIAEFKQQHSFYGLRSNRTIDLS